MEKLVITWYYGGESDGQDRTVCLNYESAEAFYFYLHGIVEKFIKDEEEYHKLFDIWHDKLRNAIKKKSSSSVKLEPQPEAPSNKFLIEGQEFNLYELRKSNKETGKYEVEMPEIQTLEEWFESQLSS